VYQLMLASVKEVLLAWTYICMKKITNWIAEIMALNSQPFGDALFSLLISQFIRMLSRNHFSEEINACNFL